MNAAILSNFSAAVESLRDVPDDVQDEIDARRALAEVRRLNASRRAELDAEWDALPNPPRTIDQHISERGR